MKTVPLTLGTVQLGQRYGISNVRAQPTDEDAQKILSAALELGVRSFDTAPVYGVAESILGRFLESRGFPDCVTVITKLSRLPSTGLTGKGVAAAVEASVEGSLERLRVGTIDHLLLHSCNDLEIYGSALISALEDQVVRNRVRRIGASIYTPAEALLLTEFPALSTVQFPLNLLDNRMHSSGALKRLKAAGFTTFARSAFLQGLFAIPPNRLDLVMSNARAPLEMLRSMLRPHGLDPMQAALPYVCAIPEVDSIVLGVDSAEQLRANVASVTKGLPEGLGSQIRSAFGETDPAVIDPRLWSVEASS